MPSTLCFFSLDLLSRRRHLPHEKRRQKTRICSFGRPLAPARVEAAEKDEEEAGKSMKELMALFASSSFDLLFRPLFRFVLQRGQESKAKELFFFHSALARRSRAAKEEEEMSQA